MQYISPEKEAISYRRLKTKELRSRGVIDLSPLSVCELLSRNPKDKANHWKLW